MKAYEKAVTWLSNYPWLFWPMVLIGSGVVALWTIFLTIVEWTYRGIGIALGMTIFFLHYPKLLALFH